VGAFGSEGAVRREPGPGTLVSFARDLPAGRLSGEHRPWRLRYSRTARLGLAFAF